MLDIVQFTKYQSSTPDRYTHQIMVPVFNYFNNHNVEELKSLIGPLHEKMILKKYQINLLFGLKQYIGKDAISFNERFLNKSNSNIRNFLLNYYACKYPYETKSFLHEYIPQEFPGIDGKQNLFQDLETKIDQLSNQITDYSFDF